MHLEATAMDLGGKLTSGKPYWRDFGWICVPKCSPPETPGFEVGFGELGFIHLGVKCITRKTIKTLGVRGTNSELYWNTPMAI